MDWWNELTDWTSSDNGWRVLSGAIIPFVAIVVAGIIAALIGRGATKRVVAMQERESRNAAVAGVVSAARKAATWGSLGHDERSYADHLAEDADIRLRLLPVSGAPLAANWAQHEIADIKKNSSTFSFQADQSLAEFRDRMLEWQARPNRAKKLFKADLERWKFDSPDPDAELIARQQDWSADQQDRREQDRPSAPAPAPAAERPTPTTTGLRPASQQPGGTPSPAAPVASSAAQAPAPASAAAPAATSAPWSARSGSEGANTTRAYGEGETTPLDGAPMPCTRFARRVAQRRAAATGGLGRPLGRRRGRRSRRRPRRGPVRRRPSGLGPARRLPHRSRRAREPRDRIGLRGVHDEHHLDPDARRRCPGRADGLGRDGRVALHAADQRE